MSEVIYFVIGALCGLVVMAIVCEKSHRAEVNELRKKIEQDSRFHYDSVSKLEDELKTQRNVIKSLNEDNVRLRKKRLSKNEQKTD